MNDGIFGSDEEEEKRKEGKHEDEHGVEEMEDVDEDVKEKAIDMMEQDKLKLSEYMGSDGVEAFKKLAGKAISDDDAIAIIKDAAADLQSKAQTTVQYEQKTYYVFIGQTPGNFWVVDDTTGERRLNEDWAKAPPPQVPAEFTASVIVPSPRGQDQFLSLNASKDVIKETLTSSGEYYVIIGNNLYDKSESLSLNLLWAKETELR